MRPALKTKISTPRFDETKEFYQSVLGMIVAEERDESDDKGVILTFESGKSEAFLEIHYTSSNHKFPGLSLQFKVDDLKEFEAKLPPDIKYEGPKPRPWGSTYLYLEDPAGVQVIVYEGGL